MNSKRLGFLAFLLVMIGMAFIVGRKSADHLAQLQAEGFVISQDFNGTPRLLVDSEKQRIALVNAKGAIQLGFDQVDTLELAFDGHKEAPVNYRIEITSSVLSDGKVAVVYENEWRARQELSRFRQLIGR